MSKEPATDESIATIEELYDKLHKFVKWVSWKRSSDHILMRQDELESELYLEMVKGWLYYKDRDLPSGQLLALMRRILDNRIAELIHKYYSTHRRVESAIIDYDLLDAGEYSKLYVHETELSVEDSVERSDAFTDFLDGLTEDERSVVDVLLYPDFRLMQQIVLSSWRKSWVFKNAVVRVNPRIISEALHIDYRHAKELWTSIRRKWRRYDKI